MTDDQGRPGIVDASADTQCDPDQGTRPAKAAAGDADDESSRSLLSRSGPAQPRKSLFRR